MLILRTLIMLSLLIVSNSSLALNLDSDKLNNDSYTIVTDFGNKVSRAIEKSVGSLMKSNGMLDAIFLTDNIEKKDNVSGFSFKGDAIEYRHANKINWRLDVKMEQSFLTLSIPI